MWYFGVSKFAPKKIWSTAGGKITRKKKANATRELEGEEAERTDGQKRQWG